MFDCSLCQKIFTRNDSLLRHLRTAHIDYPKYTDKNITIQSSNNLLDECGSGNADNMREEENSVNSYDDIGVANGENISCSDSSEHETNTLDQRITTATQAIQAKFDSLKGQRGVHKFETVKEQKNYLGRLKENSKGTTDIPNLTGLLRTALDILMIKELQKPNGKHDSDNLKSMEEDLPVKIFATEEEQQQEEPQNKRFKFNNYTYSSNSDNSKIELQNKVIKYWHNPNTLVEELKKLTTTSDVGQQISRILQRLSENNIKSVNFFEYVKQKEERSELLQNLNKLKYTDIGREIFAIINELEKAEIIEPTADQFYIQTSDRESENDESDNDENVSTEHIISKEDYITKNEEIYDGNKRNNQTMDLNEKTTIGNGLYLRPYKCL